MRSTIVFSVFLIGSHIFSVSGHRDSSSYSSSSSEEGKRHQHNHDHRRPKDEKRNQEKPKPRQRFPEADRYPNHPAPIDDPPQPPPKPAANPCPAKWLTFDRQGYRWCVLVVHANINYYRAQERCEALGGTLTGVQNNAERLALAAEGRRIQQTFGVGEGAIWLGARRKASCPRKKSCAPFDTFQWVDGETTGTAGMKFAINQPDGQIWQDKVTAQDCLQQFIFPYSDDSKLWPNIAHGSYDDQWCSKTDGPVNRFFACGKTV